MGDIGPERAHYEVLPAAADLPAPAVEVLLEALPPDNQLSDLDVVPGR